MVFCNRVETKFFGRNGWTVSLIPPRQTVSPKWRSGRVERFDLLTYSSISNQNKITIRGTDCEGQRLGKPGDSQSGFRTGIHVSKTNDVAAGNRPEITIRRKSQSSGVADSEVAFCIAGYFVKK